MPENIRVPQLAGQPLVVELPVSVKDKVVVPLAVCADEIEAMPGVGFVLKAPTETLALKPAL